ncbi:MAG: tol-pal system protein YbgF [Proteobacteria bacterium]|nr:tol-pal system protein YbgF [Pseudomonadota bacterium]
MKFYNLLISIIFFGVFYSCSTTKTTTMPVNPPEATGKSDEVLELKAKIDDLNNRIFTMNEQLESLKARIKDKSAEENVLAAYKGDKTQEKVASSSSDNNNSPMYGEYLEAFTLFKNKEYSKAMVAFSSFIDKYTNTFLTDHAYFWLGESYYQQGEYTLAIDEYLKVIKKFPDGSKTPEAMLKIAMSYKVLGEKKDSEAYLKGLISKYPNSRAATTAIRVGSK